MILSPRLSPAVPTAAIGAAVAVAVVVVAAAAAAVPMRRGGLGRVGCHPSGCGAGLVVRRRKCM